MTDIPVPADTAHTADTADGAQTSGADGATRTWAIWKPLLIVFMASGCTLVLELVAGRIMAPNIGVSIFTWTSIIGVVLLGISLGNYAGGLVADRTDPQRTLGYLLLAGGAFTLAILSLAGILPEIIDEVPFVLRIVLMTTVLFVAPTFVLGMISPIVIKATLTDLSMTGSVAGRIYAFSTFGAIVGTFLTGFVLISTFGTRSIVLGVGVVLILMGLSFGKFRGFIPGAAGIVLLAGAVGMGIVGIMGEGLLSGCDRETRYFCIKVYDEVVEGRTVRTLVLDNLIHSYTSPDEPTFLHYDYLRNYANLTEYARKSHGIEEPKFLFLGGGGYTLPRFFEVTYPNSHIEVLEVDEGVVDVNYELIGLDRETRIISHAIDARIGIQDVRLPKYDMIFGDAFNDVSVPYHLTTVEFTQQIHDLLTDDGYYAALVIDAIDDGLFLRSYVLTLQQVFPHVRVMGSRGSWEGLGMGTYVVVGSKRPIDVTTFEETSSAGSTRLTGLMPEDFQREWLAEGPPEPSNAYESVVRSLGRLILGPTRPVILTDDYAPVDNLLAPIVLRRNQ